MQKIRLLVITLVALALLASSAAVLADVGPGPAPSHSQTVTLTGKLVQVAAIGGETTGWALKFPKPTVVSGKKIKQIEVDPHGKNLAPYADKTVHVTGTVETRTGVERGDYQVLVLQSIRK